MMALGGSLAVRRRWLRSDGSLAASGPRMRRRAGSKGASCAMPHQESVLISARPQGPSGHARCRCRMGVRAGSPVRKGMAYSQGAVVDSPCVPACAARSCVLKSKVTLPPDGACLTLPRHDVQMRSFSSS